MATRSNKPAKTKAQRQKDLHTSTSQAALEAGAEEQTEGNGNGETENGASVHADYSENSRVKELGISAVRQLAHGAEETASGQASMVAALLNANDTVTSWGYSKMPTNKRGEVIPAVYLVPSGAQENKVAKRHKAAILREIKMTVFSCIPHVDAEQRKQGKLLFPQTHDNENILEREIPAWFDSKLNNALTVAAYIIDWADTHKKHLGDTPVYCIATQEDVEGLPEQVQRFVKPGALGIIAACAHNLHETVNGKPDKTKKHPLVREMLNNIEASGKAVKQNFLYTQYVWFGHARTARPMTYVSSMAMLERVARQYLEAYPQTRDRGRDTDANAPAESADQKTLRQQVMTADVGTLAERDLSSLFDAIAHKVPAGKDLAQSQVTELSQGVITLVETHPSYIFNALMTALAEMKAEAFEKQDIDTLIALREDIDELVAQWDAAHSAPKAPRAQRAAARA